MSKSEAGESTARILTHRSLECLRLALPCDHHKINRDAGKNHQQAVAGFDGAGDHRNDNNESGGDEIEHRPNHRDADRAN